MFPPHQLQLNATSPLSTSCRIVSALQWYSFLLLQVVLRVFSSESFRWISSVLVGWPIVVFSPFPELSTPSFSTPATRCPASSECKPHSSFNLLSCKPAPLLHSSLRDKQHCELYRFQPLLHLSRQLPHHQPLVFELCKMKGFKTDKGVDILLHDRRRSV